MLETKCSVVVSGGDKGEYELLDGKTQLGVQQKRPLILVKKR
jgi:hypothetical protein